jgi:hypothetical protein
MFLSLLKYTERFDSALWFSSNKYSNMWSVQKEAELVKYSCNEQTQVTPDSGAA